MSTRQIKVVDERWFTDLILLACAAAWAYQLIGHPIGAALGTLVWFKFVYRAEREDA